MTSQDLMPDRLGAYRLLTRIGEGGMGVVFLARGPGQQSVALKVLRSGVAGEPTARRRLAREVETMQRVRSPHVAEVIDADLAGDMPYIVTRYVPGRTLDEVVSEQGRLTGPGLARLACGLAEALVAVHAAGVVHRDLKPGNVMLLDGSPVVIDFGIAQGPDATRLTMTGMFMGTPGYLAPEVIEGHPSSQASDVHAWGATVAFAAIGHPPYGTGSYEGIFYRIVNGQPDLATVPPSLLPLLTAALARNPAHRPSALHLAAQASVLDPAALVPAPAGPAAAAGLAGGARTVADSAPATLLPPPGAPATPAGPGLDLSTRAAGALPGAPHPGAEPLNAAAPLPEDVADVLPPVRYQPGAGNGQRPGGATPPPGGLAGLTAGDRAAPQTRWQSLLVLATMVAAASVSVILPVVGTVASLLLIMVLRAAGLAQRRGALRRLARGRRPSDPLLAVMGFPWFLIRSLFALLLLAPFAVAAAAAATAVTVTLVPGDWPSRALAFAAGAFVAFYGLGPGSRTTRTQLKRVYAAVATSRAAQAGTAACLTVLAVAALGAALSWPSVYWPTLAPAGYLHIGFIHLRPLRSAGLLYHAGLSHRVTLLRHLVLHQFGLLPGSG